MATAKPAKKGSLKSAASAAKKAVARAVNKVSKPKPVAKSAKSTPKPAPKKAAAKPVAKKAVAKKAAKPVAKKAPAKKAAAKKPSPKPVAKKAPAKKAAAKPAPKKAAAKPVAKKAVAKKAAKPVAKTAAAKKAVAKKVAAKPVAKKAAAKKVATKPVAKKVEPKKLAPAKSAKVEAKIAKPKATEVKKPAPAEVAAQLPVADTKPRGRRRAPLAPEDIPAPVPLAHQAAIEVPKAFAQPDSRPKEKARVTEDETIWTAAELKAMRKRFDADLVERAAAVEAANAMLARISDSDEGAGGETADTGNAILEREEQLTRVADAEAQYEQTRAALERLDQKRYAFCDECSRPIGKLRLQEANPYATLCISCQEIADREF